MSDHLPLFRRFYKAFDLPTKSKRVIVEEASEDERALIAEGLGVLEINRFHIDAKLIPAGDGVWRAAGTVTADVVQSCVVTLAPVAATVLEPFDRVFSRFAEEDTPIDIDIDYDQDDPPEPLGDGVDIGAVAVEALSLGLDPYPRAPGAAFQTIRAAPPGVEPLSPDIAKPFAGLASLKKTMEGPD